MLITMLLSKLFMALPSTQKVWLLKAASLTNNLPSPYYVKTKTPPSQFL